MMAGDREKSLAAAESAQLVRNGQPLLNLYRRWAPTAPTTTHSRPNWEVFSLACLARAHFTLETILGIQDRELDAITLTRCLYEHVATFAWLAIDPDRHYPMLLRWEQRHREKMCIDLEKFGAVAPSVDTVRRAMVDAGHDSAPETADRALQADRYWQRIRQDWTWGFRRTYAGLFRPYSAYVHPTVMGLDPFVRRTPAGPAVAQEPRANPALEFGPSAVASFADGLAVASHRLGWPPFPDLVFIFTHGIATDGG